ncbi:Replication protein P, partial [Pseudomonas sp. HMWF031]
VWHTAKEAGFENLNRLETSLAKKLFERNYVITVRRLVDGLPLQKMPLALPARAEGRRTPEVGNKALAELRARRAGATQ